MQDPSPVLPFGTPFIVIIIHFFIVLLLNLLPSRIEHEASKVHRVLPAPDRDPPEVGGLEAVGKLKGEVDVRVLAEDLVAGAAGIGDLCFMKEKRLFRNSVVRNLYNYPKLHIKIYSIAQL